MSFRFVPTQRVIENSKKIAKIFKKLKNPVMASFQAKIGWTKRRKRQNKNCLSVPFLSDGKYKIRKKEKKNKKIKKYHCGFISCQNRLENAEKMKK